MEKYQFRDFSIVILDDPAYTYDSPDNAYNYPKKYFSNDENSSFWKYGIKIHKNDQVINGCILLGEGGKTIPHNNSIILEDDQLLVCCGDTVFCLSLPDLELRWKTKADTATCFQIFKLEEDLLVHGELEVTRLDKNGNIKWEFSGQDIFVTLNGEDAFILNSDSIELTDFNNEKYKIDFHGNIIWTSIKPS